MHRLFFISSLAPYVSEKLQMPNVCKRKHYYAVQSINQSKHISIAPYVTFQRQLKIFLFAQEF